MKPIKHCLKKEGWGKGEWEAKEEVNLFQVHCMNV
jgi:hypothetical protein